MVDFPGYAEGDELVLRDGSSILGVDSVSGTATITRLAPAHVAFAVGGSIGPLGQDLAAELRQVSREQAEFTLGGLGFDSPFLVEIQVARRNHLSVMPHGGIEPVVIERTSDGDLRMRFAIGGQKSVIVAGRP